MENSESPQTWPPLSMIERRILGVLVEKAKTTPDVYPMSVNSLVAGCNQKSNRDPVLNLSDAEVEETLGNLQQKGMTIRVTGSRVERWRQSLYEVWKVDKVELAVLAELLLRGPQTEGELRTRTSRMEPVEDLDKLRQILRPLTERGLVIFLGPEGRRGTLITHGFHPPQELERLKASGGAAPEATGEPRPAFAPAKTGHLEADLAQVQTELAQLRDQVQHLQQAVADLNQKIEKISPLS